VFERGLPETPVIGKVLAVGLVDEITDRQYVIVYGADGRGHYAELGRPKPEDAPGCSMIESLIDMGSVARRGRGIRSGGARHLRRVRFNRKRDREAIRTELTSRAI